MQIPILSGIYGEPSPDLRTSYPMNLRPVPKNNGISAGYLRVNDGVEKNGDGPGIVRGGIEWFGRCYRVMGTKLVEVLADGSVVELGDVGGTGTVSMTYSFDRLAIASGLKLFLWDGATLVEVTDPDLGIVLDIVWVDGYFITTDGENIVVTELNDPTQVDPLKYGSSEVDPDPVVGVLKLRNELYAVNRHSIEIFQNVGGSGFPFQVVRGGQTYKGAIGTHCAVVYKDVIAFLGSGRNEAPAVWIGGNGGAQKISTREIDEVLMTYTEEQLADAFLEVQVEKNHDILMMHLPNETYCYDANATVAAGQPAWFKLTTGVDGGSPYTARHFVWAFDKWLVGSTIDTSIGFTTDATSDVWGNEVAWQFGTPIVYNGSRGGIFHELELVAMSGAVPVSKKASIYTQYSLDGVSWSQKRYVDAGSNGQRDKRFRWFRNGRMSNWRIQRFGGTSRSPIAASRLEAQIEGLAW